MTRFRLIEMCNHDCFNCQYEDCINDKLSFEDIETQDELDDELRVKRRLQELSGQTGEKVRTLRSYYRHIEKRRAYGREYSKQYRKTHEIVDTTQKERAARYNKTEKAHLRWKRYYETHKEELLAKQRERKRIARESKRGFN